MEHSKTYVAIPLGETIKEQLSFRGMSQKEFAVRMCLSEKHITNLLKGRVQLTSDVAMRLESVLGSPAIFWENLESLYREALIKVKEENQIDSDAEIVKKLPYSDMVKCGWVVATSNLREKIKSLQKFFEVAKLDVLSEPTINHIACRRSAFGNESDYALLAWAQKAKLEARNYNTKPVSVEGLKKSLPQIRAMSVLPPEEFCPKLIEILSDNGIALVFLPHIKSSSLNGASFRDGKKIVIGLTVRGKYADIFWFSLFHEIGHVIYKHIDQIDGVSEVDEKKADVFARETLIPSKELNIFIENGVFNSDSLIKYARNIGTDVGILVGRLQHDGVIKHTQFNDLKTKYVLI